MANELIYSGAPASDSGLTIIGRVYGVDGVQVGGNVTMTEVGILAFYRGNMPTASAGKYYVRFFDGATLKDQFILFWGGTLEITLLSLDISFEDAALIAR